MSEDFGARSAALVRDFLSQPGAQLHPSLEIADLRSRGRGRGILAKADIPAGAELFTIPRDYIISVDKSELAQAHAGVFEDLASDSLGAEEDALPKPWLDLILVLLHDYLHMSTSRWQAYWNVLPTEFDSLMFWSEQDLHALQASAVRNHIGKEKADALFLNRVIPVVRKHAAIFYPSEATQLSEQSLLTLCHRMGSLIMAYAFDLQMRPTDSDSEFGEDGWVEDREVEVAMGMVPLADTLNADAEFNAHIEHETDRLVARSLRPIGAHEEVLNFYGPLPNCDLLRRYGYTSPLHARYDVVEVPWTLLSQVIEKQLGEGACSKLNDADDLEDFEESFILERDSGEPNDQGSNTTQAKFTNFPEDLVDQVTTFTSRALKIDTTESKPTPREARTLKLAFLRVIREALDQRAAEYPTSIEADEIELKEAHLTTRHRMAIKVRLGEKEVLREAHALATALVEKYADADMQKKKRVGDEAPARKPWKKAR